MVSSVVTFCLMDSLTEFHDESSGVRHVRRMFHPGRGLGGPRARRSNMHFTSSTTGGLSGSQSSSQSSNYTREAMDPIAGQCDSTDTHTHTQLLTVGVCFGVWPCLRAELLLGQFAVGPIPTLMRFSAWHVRRQLQLCHNEGPCSVCLKTCTDFL